MEQHIMGIRWLWIWMCVGALYGAPVRAERVTFGSLLREMTCPDRLTRLPEHPSRLMHASSYDRLAVLPHTPNWFANTDWSNYVRSETVAGRTEYVLMEADGPGAIVRFWVTIMGAGDVLRIYLDGAAVPLVEGTLTDIIGRSAWINSPLSFLAPFSEGTGTGHNLYLPIPFATHCKVTVSTPSERLYYNIDYRLYDPEVEVESFTENTLNLYSTEYVDTVSALAAGHPDSTDTSACHRVEGVLTWGGHKRSVTLKGPSAIRLLRFKLSAPDVQQALRSTHLEIDFDDEQNAVRCPIGDFFCTGYTVTTGGTWFAEIDLNGVMHTYWVMPFRECATIRLVNHGQQTVDILQGEIWTGDYTWDNNSMHFHAAWREYTFEDTIAWTGKDLNYVTLQGCGRLVGDTLAIFNDATTVPHWHVNWWGEGDEKIYVDGEPFPSHFGTGTEDYYGYAWCSAQTFNSPFIAQPLGSGNDKTGNTINTRLRLLDDIPYRTGLKFDMELLSQQTGKHRFAPAVFWYARPGGVCFTPDPLARSVLPVPRTTSGIEQAPSYCPISVRKGIEAMSVSQNTGGTLSSVQRNGLGLSDENCVLWQNCVVGSRIEFGFSASFTGQCSLVMRALSEPSSGVLRVSINGEIAANEVDLYALTTAPVRIPLGTHVLQEGANVLAFEVVGVPVGMQQVDFLFDDLENEGPYYVSRVLPVLRERLEGESLAAVATCGEMAIVSNSPSHSGDQYAVWSHAEVGEFAVFQIVSPEARHVPLTGVFVCATNGATCDVHVNGNMVCQGLDLCRTELAITNVLFGAHVFLPGTNEITVSISGCSNGLDPEQLMVGLDCLEIGSFYACNFEKQSISPLTGPYEDPDGDGFINLVEYAFGGDPERGDGAALCPFPIVLQEEGETIPVISYRRRNPESGLPVLGIEGVNLLVDGVVYQVQETIALGAGTHWRTTNEIGATVQAIGEPDDDDGKTVRVRVRAVEPLANGHPGTRFMRVGLREP